MKRATMEDIKNHDWFKKDLPAYLFPLPNDNDASIIDMDAVKVVCEKFGVQEKELHSALLSGNPHDQLAIAYNLVVDNKRIEDETAKLEIKDFYVASSPPPTAALLDVSRARWWQGHSHALLTVGQSFKAFTVLRVPKTGKGRLEGKPGKRASCPRSEVRSATSSAAGHRQAAGTPLAGGRMLSGGNGADRKGTPMKRAKWHLGIRSQSKPHDIMNEVYRAMKALDFEWKVVNSFHVRVRRKNPSNARPVKMSLQLYQVEYKSFLLDFKSLPTNEEAQSQDPSKQSRSAGVAETSYNQVHNTMEFFEMCAALITQLAR
ncbi:unnamed protein product [Ixodes persulcatus]